MTADVVDLDAYRRTEPVPVPAMNVRAAVCGEDARRPDLAQRIARIAHGPAARDLRRLRDEHDQALAVALLLAVLIVLLIGVAS